MNKKLFLFLFLFLPMLSSKLFCVHDTNKNEKPFVFIIASYKNIEWYKGVTKEISLNVAQGIYIIEIRSVNERFVGKVGVLR